MSTGGSVGDTPTLELSAANLASPLLAAILATFNGDQPIALTLNGPLPTSGQQSLTGSVTQGFTFAGGAWSSVSLTLTASAAGVYTDATLLFSDPGAIPSFLQIDPSLPPFSAAPLPSGDFLDGSSPGSLDIAALTLGFTVSTTDAIGTPAAMTLGGSLATLPVIAPITTQNTGPFAFTGQIVGDGPALAPLPPGLYPWLLDTQVPGLMLSAQFDPEITFDMIDLPVSQGSLQIYSPSSSVWLSGNPSFCSVVAVDIPATLAIGETSVPVTLIASGFGSGPMTVEGYFSGAGLTLTDMLTLLSIDQDALTGTLPSDVITQLESTDTSGSGSNTIALQSLLISMPTSTSCDMIAARFTFGANFSIAEVDFTDIAFTLTLTPSPLTVAACIDAQMTMFAIPMAVELTLSDSEIQITAMLVPAVAPQTNPTLDAVVTAISDDTTFLSAIDDDLAGIDVAQLSFSGVIGTGYAFSVELVNSQTSASSCSATIGGQVITLDSIAFTYNSMQQTTFTSFGGEVTINDNDYFLTLSSTGASFSVIPTGTEQLDDIIADFGMPAISLPSALDPVFLGGSVFVGLGNNDGTVVAAIDLDIGDMQCIAMVCSTKLDGQSWTGASLTLGLDIDICSLSLIKDVAPGQSLNISTLQFLYASAATTAAQTTIIQQAVAASGSPFASFGNFPSTALIAGMSSALSGTANAKPLLFYLPGEGGPSIGAEQSLAASSGDGLTWSPLQIALGPVTLSAIGVGYSSGGVALGITGSLALGPLGITLQQFAIAVPLSNDPIPSFSLGGLGVDYDGGGISVEGAFQTLQPPPAGTSSAYDGLLSVTAESFDFSAVGAYAVLDDGSTSLLAIADVAADIGGPPFFTVTGFCGGFGYNRALQLPPIAQAQSFPLLAVADGQMSFGGLSDLPKIEQALAAYMAPQEGQDWGAAGITFSSFGVVQGVLMLAIAAGVQTEFALLGSASLVLPQDEDTPRVNVAIDIEASYIPSAGTLTVLGQIAPNSYIIDPSFVLSGGFAVCAWFDASAHPGDFVATIGGYANDYSPPTWYPVVPRLQLAWQDAGSSLSVTGDAYFAVVPNSLMLGVGMQAIWQKGSIHASFTAQADFAFGWAPFFYQADIGVMFSVTATIDLAITTIDLAVTIGAQLDIGGPPFGGSALIDLSVISFTIDFGQRNPAPPALDWASFSSSFLPAAAGSGDHAAQARMDADAAVTAGIIISVASGQMNTSAAVAAGLTLVDGEKASFSVALSVPATSVTGAGTTPTSLDGLQIGIAPMEQSSVTSVVALSVSPYGKSPTVSLVAMSPVTGSVPAAMYYYDPDTPAPSSLLTGHLTGIALVPDEADNYVFPAASPDYAVAILEDGNPINKNTDWQPSPIPAPDPYAGDDPITTLVTTIAANDVSATRQAILVALANAGFPVPETLDATPLTIASELMMNDIFQLAPIGSIQS